MTELALFEEHRPLLFSIAYRMLGSATDAEDVLQDAWVRLSAADTADVRSLRAFASTVVTRLCLDRLKSARSSRESYIGPWLPEPLLTSGDVGPDLLAQRSESVTLAFLLLLEALSPEERAVFLLKEVYEYSHGEIAEMLGTSPANSRQLFHRAKARVARRRPRTARAETSARAVAEQFARAFSDGDPAQLTTLLAADVGFWSDGGGKASAARRPLLGRAEVLNFLIGLHRTSHATGQAAQARLRMVDANHEPALVLNIGDRLESVFVLSVDDGVISRRSASCAIPTSSPISTANWRIWSIDHLFNQ